MDVVYPYKATLKDFELRYSLRSLRYMDHDRVIIAGDVPRGLKKVTLIAVDRIGSRYASSTANIKAAVDFGELSDRFVVMHDDIFLLNPWSFRHEHRCTIEEYLSCGGSYGAYRQQTELTRDILKAHGVDDPLCFSLHTPTVYERDKMADLMREFAGRTYLLRTLYHNLFPAPSVQRDDVKIKVWKAPGSGQDVISISDGIASRQFFRNWINDRFPLKSRYEV